MSLHREEGSRVWARCCSEKPPASFKGTWESSKWYRQGCGGFLDGGVNEALQLQRRGGDPKKPLPPRPGTHVVDTAPLWFLVPSSLAAQPDGLSPALVSLPVPNNTVWVARMWIILLRSHKENRLFPEEGRRTVCPTSCEHILFWFLRIRCPPLVLRNSESPKMWARYQA